MPDEQPPTITPEDLWRELAMKLFAIANEAIGMREYWHLRALIAIDERIKALQVQREPQLELERATQRPRTLTNEQLIRMARARTRAMDAAQAQGKGDATER